MSVALRGSSELRGPLLLSAVAHLVVMLALLVVRTAAPPALPLMYEVNLVAAPVGERAAGVVRDPVPESVTPPAAAPTPTRVERNDPGKTAPIKAPTVKAPTRATPSPAAPAKAAPAKAAPAARAPTAGGGAVGGTGTDVATVRTEGIQFPFPGYLQNIVRQIALNFRPRNPGALTAEVLFFIHRDGSVSGFRFVQRSGNFAFDVEAEGAVEAATGAFGPLPKGFGDDILPVTFRFDPARLR
ncbi:MAG: energy transducer TonB [Gemmatimonadota bacterium]|nr:energy transducer TonB [Gemmatimonadota bacterium]